MFSPYNASDIFAMSFLRTLPGGDALDFGVAGWVADAIAPDFDEAGTQEQEELSKEAPAEEGDAANDDSIGNSEE